MKMLKKMAALLLAGVMAMALLTACGDEAPSKSFAQQTEETVFSFYSKALGVEKNDADMKKLAEKTLGYIDEDGVVTIHEDMVDSGKPVPPPCQYFLLNFPIFGDCAKAAANFLAD